MKRKLILLAEITLAVGILLLAYQLIAKVDLRGFCKHCGARMQTNRIVLFEWWNKPIVLWQKDLIVPGGVSLYLNSEPHTCEKVFTGGSSRGLFGELRLCMQGGSARHLWLNLISDADAAGQKKFLEYYEKKYDPQLKEHLAEMLSGRENQTLNDNLLNCWYNEYR